MFALHSLPHLPSRCGNAHLHPAPLLSFVSARRASSFSPALCSLLWRSYNPECDCEDWWTVAVPRWLREATSFRAGRAVDVLVAVSTLFRSRRPNKTSCREMWAIMVSFFDGFFSLTFRKRETMVPKLRLCIRAVTRTLQRLLELRDSFGTTRWTAFFMVTGPAMVLMSSPARRLGSPLTRRQHKSMG